MKKIKVLIPNEIKEILEKDRLYCKKSMNNIHNKIVEHYLKNGINKVQIKIKTDSQIQFYLYDFLIDSYFKFLKENNYSSESDFLRDIYYDYINKLKDERLNILNNNKGENHAKQECIKRKIQKEVGKDISKKSQNGVIDFLCKINKLLSEILENFSNLI